MSHRKVYVVTDAGNRFVAVFGSEAEARECIARAQADGDQLRLHYCRVGEDLP